MIHLYSGDGKGKTTAATGLSVRAAGCGKKVLFTQFMKGGKTGELVVLRNLPCVEVIRSEKDFPFYSKMNEEQKAELTGIHNEILTKIERAVLANETDMVIMDEITYPYMWGLMDRELFHRILEYGKERIELVLTGRNPDESMVKEADYHTEMKCHCHPYEKGIVAREGVEY